jgi:hypothetical protein
MANVVKKHSISYELAQKMVNAAVAKATQLHQGRPVAFGRHPHAFACGGVGWRVSHQGQRRGCRGDRGERSAHGAERHRLRESGPYPELFVSQAEQFLTSALQDGANLQPSEWLPFPSVVSAKRT